MRISSVIFLLSFLLISSVESYTYTLYTSDTCANVSTSLNYSVIAINNLTVWNGEFKIVKLDPIFYLNVSCGSIDTGLTKFTIAVTDRLNTSRLVNGYSITGERTPNPDACSTFSGFSYNNSQLRAVRGGIKINCEAQQPDIKPNGAQSNWYSSGFALWFAVMFITLLLVQDLFIDI